MPVIAQMFAATEGYVLEGIHTFNDLGFAVLDPQWSGGSAILSRQLCRSTPVPGQSGLGSIWVLRPP